MYKNKYACHTKKYPEEVQSKSGRRIVLDSISFFFFFFNGNLHLWSNSKQQLKTDVSLLLAQSYIMIRKSIEYILNGEDGFYRCKSLW